MDSVYNSVHPVIPILSHPSHLIHPFHSILSHPVHPIHPIPLTSLPTPYIHHSPSNPSPPNLLIQDHPIPSHPIPFTLSSLSLPISSLPSLPIPSFPFLSSPFLLIPAAPSGGSIDKAQHEELGSISRQGHPSATIQSHCGKNQGDGARGRASVLHVLT